MNKKNILLIIGLLFDFIGMMSYIVPLLGETFDFIWAPISALAIFIMYRGVAGALAGIISGVEEVFVGIDFIPTFTLMWVYTYYLKNK